MNKEELFNIKIDEIDKDIYKQIKRAWDKIAKPLDGLGDFEELICKIGAIQRKITPDILKRALVVMCADNGIVEEGISQSGKEVTLAVARNLAGNISSASRLAEGINVDVIPIDIGIASDEDTGLSLEYRIRNGSRNFLVEPALTEKEALLAIESGILLVKKLKDKGYRVIATGEMGIGNTTTATAVLSALLDLNPEKVTGRGAGLSDEGLKRKISVIKQGISKYEDPYATDSKEYALKILSSLGGYDIAGLCGVFIGGAIYKIPIVTDGIISSAAAVCAKKIVPGAGSYMIASHEGREAGNMVALEKLGLKAYIKGNMALGEGTGALMLFPLLDMVYRYYVNGTDFSTTALEEYKRFDNSGDR